MAVYLQTGRAGTKPYWAVDFKWKDPVTGKSQRIRRVAKDAKGRPARSQTAAEQCEARMRDQLARGVFDMPDDAADTPALSAYQETYLADARVRLKPQTIGHIEKCFRTIMPLMGEKRLDQIDAAAVAALTRTLHERELSAKSINNVLSSLRAVLAHAEEHEVIGAVPKFRWQRLPPASFDFFTFEETAKLLEHAHPMAHVALRTGLRIGELLALRWGDVALDRKQITVERSLWWGPGGEKHEGAPKNHKPRTIPLTADALAALKGMRADGEAPRRAYVFADGAGNPLTLHGCKWPLWRVQDAAGLRRTGWHILRHTFASHLAMRGVALPAIQALMGHSTIQMTMKYAHLAPDHLRSAIDALG